ncbi:hypothetical protein [uncultured Cocleimonas sp.]|uniref:hypothetical protein n=1 Tax=uncultured Cocleimonas sp. TaxID=1051587 RepID=UPI0026034A71|nr:hypothetical protein [uncultured Cocleimonas sp.]
MNNQIPQNISAVNTRKKTSLLSFMNRLLMITFMTVLLQACQSDADTESTDIIQTVAYSTDDGRGILSNDDQYELLLRADSTYLTLEDDISDITIQGDGNYLVIDSDTNINEINIIGNDNIITVANDVDLTINLLNLIGNGNSVVVFKITTYNQTSDANAPENLACEASDNGFCF